MPTHIKDPYTTTAEPAEKDPYAATADSVQKTSIDSLTENTKKQGTYRMLPPVGQEDVYGKTGIMVPYGNINAARQAGFGFDPKSGDDTRYAHDLFTELKGKGQSPSGDDATLTKQFGVVPTPSPGSKEWFKRGGRHIARFGIDMLPTAGAIAGGVAAGVPGALTGPGDVAVAGAGAAAGATEGEVLRQSLNQRFFGEKLTAKESAKRIGIQAGLGATQEAGGRYAAKPLGAAAKYFGRTAEASAKTGIRQLPSEVEGKAPTWLENFLKGSVLSKGIMEKFREAQNKESSAAVDKIMDSVSKFKGTPEQLGKMVQDGIDQSTKTFHDQQNALYDALDKATQEKVVNVPTPIQVRVFKDGKPVLDAAGKQVMKTVMQPRATLQGAAMPSMVGLKDFARQKLAELNMPPHMLPKDELEKARGLFQTILDNPDRVSFKRMRAERSTLLAMGRKLDETLGSSKGGLVKKLAELSDQSLETAAKNSKIPGLYDRWREANAFTAEGHRMFEQKLVEKAEKSENPEFIAALLGGNKIGLQQTRDLFKVLPQKLHDPVRRGLLEDAVSKATEPRTRAFDEGKFASAIDKIGDERGEVIFGKNWKNIKGLVDVIGKINGPVGLAGGGGAALQNIGIVKRLAAAAFSLPATAIALGAGTGHLNAGLMGAGILGAADVVGLAGTVASAKIVARAMVNPAKTAAMLKVARAIARGIPYAPSVGYNETKKVPDYINNTVDDLAKPKETSPDPAGPQSSVAPAPNPRELMEKARSLNPSGQGQVAYSHLAVNPETGHKIGSRDGINWIDVVTGQKVA